MSGWEGEGRHRPTLVSRSEAGAGVGAAVSSGVACLQMILGATIAGILAANHRTMGEFALYCSTGGHQYSLNWQAFISLSESLVELLWRTIAEETK